MRYLIIIEATQTGYSAYAPDLPGCVATGESRKIVEQEIREAITLHLKGLVELGLAIPAPNSSSAYIEIPN